jgi:hypothetical protein
MIPGLELPVAVNLDNPTYSEQMWDSGTHILRAIGPFNFELLGADRP